MRHNRLPAIMMLAAALGCGSERQAVEMSSAARSSRMVSVQTVREADTVTVVLPEVHISRHIRDSVSTIRAPHAVSRAEICPDGTLRHELHLLPDTLTAVGERSVERSVTAVENDTLRMDSRQEAPAARHSGAPEWAVGIALAAMAVAMAVALVRISRGR